jgi:hypothetical protein
LSKVAILSAGGTRSGEPCFVTRSTNVTIEFFVAVSFHDGSGSVAGVCARADMGRIGPISAGSKARDESRMRRLTPRDVRGVVMADALLSTS